MSLLRWRREEEDDEDNGFAKWGGYMQAKKAKLQEQYTETTEKETEKVSDIFKGVAIFVNGLTNPNSDELKKIMAANGGTFHLYQISTTTHIIASNLPNVKINKLGSVPIVKPSWISDSLSLGKLLDYKRYLLYTNQSTTQPKLNFSPLPLQVKTASDPDFLQEFYGNSRLHLIATLGVEFKQLISQLREESTGSFPSLEKLEKRSLRVSLPSPIIMHIDMDCFFVSVALKSHPELRGVPLAVTHARNAQIKASKEREEAVAVNLDRLPMRMENVDGRSSMSEIASCSYEARRAGVKNGMFLGAAVKLCPDLKTIQYDFEGYKEVSTLLYKTLAGYTLDIEAVSCDEMYVNISDILKTKNLTVEEWSRIIRQEIERVTGCPCSTGFGSNRLQARMATKKAKPNGSFFLRPEEVEEYMSKVKLSELPGVGHATLSKLTKLNLSTCGDIQNVELATLQRELGHKQSELLMDQARGIDKKPLSFHYERKSVSAEINYGIRFQTVEEVNKFLFSLSMEAWKRLSEIKMRARGVTLKLMVRSEDAPVETAKFLGHGLCDSFSKSVTTSYLVSNVQSVFKEVKVLYGKMNVDFRELRGVGIQLTKLEKAQREINPTLKEFLQTKKVVKKTEKSDTLTKSKETLLEIKKEESKEKIDLEVLSQLPEDLRCEIMEEYGLKKKELSDVKSVSKSVRKKSIFSGVGWEQLRASLYAWFSSESAPNEVDVNFLGEHFEDLALNREIDILRVAFNFLYRNMSSLNCSWHQSYYKIVSFAQRGMMERYGSVLKIERSFKCNNCKVPC